MPRTHSGCVSTAALSSAMGPAVTSAVHAVQLFRDQACFRIYSSLQAWQEATDFSSGQLPWGQSVTGSAGWAVWV